jgi:hypothetical protein
MYSSHKALNKFKKEAGKAPTFLIERLAPR